MRRWLSSILAGASLVAALSGCGGVSDGTHDNADSGTGLPAVSPPSPRPAADSGGACRLLDYPSIEAATGTVFDVAAAGATPTSFTCVVRRSSASLPDLSLSVTSTEADTSAFRGTVRPKNAATVSGLGKIGYSVSVPPAGGAGPGLEIGWLSGNKRLITLRYRDAVGTSSPDVNSILPKLVELAKKIDLTSV